ncbi:alginate export family protein [Novosphingobium piscinae]|uniref:Alginate export family protein n=1 Tax=Novosphingobium piscinae TaxID=1507448 RepID=A0A7X1FW29_9SPHN|nr:alginate export family protein [Novosphingobium piscinae]MBC2668031.1 alginate export family protein [Novosphingobium piscinae]
MDRLRIGAIGGIVALGLAAPGRADTVPEGLTVHGTVRLRLDAIDGQPRVGGNSSDVLYESRTQIRAVWRRDWLRLVGELHDSRVWGANPGTPLGTGEVNALEPVIAHVEADLGPLFGSGSEVSVQLGRLGLSLGSRRLVAIDDYRNTITAFTGLRGDLATRSGIRATAFYALPLLRLPDDGPGLRANRVALDKESFDTVLWGGFLAQQRQGSPLLREIAFLHLGERDAPGRPSRDRSLDTLSLRLVREPRPGAAEWGLEGIYQWGSISATAAAGAPRQSVSASFWRVHAGYSFGGPWQPHVQIEFDHASGDGPGGSYGRFDTLYGMRRADLAPAGLYNAIARSNVVSPGIRVEVTPSRRVDAFLGYRALWLADSRDGFSSTGVRDPSGASGTWAGHQLDGRVRWWLVPQRWRFEITTVLLAKGRFLRTAPNAPPGATTRYGSLNLTASF